MVTIIYMNVHMEEIVQVMQKLGGKLELTTI